MKIYVAASYPRKAEAIALADDLREEGHEIISGWHGEDEGYNTDGREETPLEQCKRLSAAAERDIQDLLACDAIVCITDGETQLTHGGRHSELGICLALHKRVIIVGPREQVFHYHPLVHHYSSVESFLLFMDLTYEAE